MADEKIPFNPLPEDVCMILRKYTGSKLATTGKGQYIKDCVFYERKIEALVRDFHIQFAEDSLKNIFYFYSAEISKTRLNIGKDLSLLVNFCSILEKLAVHYKIMYLLPTFSKRESFLFNRKLAWLFDDFSGVEKDIAITNNPVISFMLALFYYNYTRHDAQFARELKTRFGDPKELLANAQRLGCINAQALLEIFNIKEQNKVKPLLWAKVFNPLATNQIEIFNLPVDSRGRAIARLLIVNPKAQKLIERNSNFLECNLATLLCVVAQLFPDDKVADQFWLNEFDSFISSLIQTRDQQYQLQERAFGRYDSVLRSQNVISSWRLHNLLKLLKNNRKVFSNMTELQLLNLVTSVDSLLACFTLPGLFGKWDYEEVVKFLGAEYKELRTHKVLACFPNLIRLVITCEELKEFVLQISTYPHLNNYVSFDNFTVTNLTELASLVVKKKIKANNRPFANLINNINYMASVCGSLDKFIIFLDDLFKLHVEVVVKQVFLENRIEISKANTTLTPDCLMLMSDMCNVGRFVCFMWAPVEIVRYIASSNNSMVSNMLLSLSYKEYQQLRNIVEDLSSCELLVKEKLAEVQNVTLLHWVLENLEGLNNGFEKITAEIKKYHLLLLKILKRPVDALSSAYHLPDLIPDETISSSQADQHPMASR